MNQQEGQCGWGVTEWRGETREGLGAHHTGPCLHFTQCLLHSSRAQISSFLILKKWLTKSPRGIPGSTGPPGMLCPHIPPLPSAQWDPHFLHLGRPPLGFISYPPTPSLEGGVVQKGKKLEHFFLSDGVVLPFPVAGPGRISPRQHQGPASLSEPKVLCPHGHLRERQGASSSRKPSFQAPVMAHRLCPMCPSFPIFRGPQNP